jgi:hypothetical protein
MKITYYREDIAQEIKRFIPRLGATKIDLDYRGRSVRAKKCWTKKKPWWRLWATESKSVPVGGIPVEGIPDILTLGITLAEWGINETKNITRVLIESALIYYFYGIIDKKESADSPVEKKPKEKKYALQIVTDEHLAETGELDPHRKTISFLFQEGLTKEQFTRGYNTIPEVRKRIQDLLDIASSENTDRIKCTFSGVDWDIDFVNRKRNVDATEV